MGFSINHNLLKIETMWKSIKEETPPKNKVLKTKIDDRDGVRNEQELKWDGKLWWTPDGKMYVYYEPTHWYYPI